MSSRHIEDTHSLLLSKILSESGLKCYRKSPVESLVSAVIEEEEQELEEEQHEEEENEPELQQEEEYIPSITETEEEDTLVFPTPSLRRVVPERVRRLEAQNCIHVLPEVFRTNIDPQVIPKIKSTPQQKYIQMLAEIVGCADYKTSLAEFWFLDTLANLLRRAQDDKLDRPTQAVLILWWCEWMKEIQEFDAADRPRMMRRFKDTMLAAARYVAGGDHLPTPAQAAVHHKARPVGTDIETVSFDFGDVSYECSLRDLAIILHYIYDVFSTDFQFDLVRAVFTFPPEYRLTDAPYQMKQPKTMYRVVNKIKKKPEPKPKAPEKTDQKKKGGKKEVEKENEEYAYLMSVRARDQEEHEAQEEVDFELWQRKSHILPLQFAVAEDFLDKYWPPPPPPEPEPEPEPEPQPAKKKGNK